MIRQAFVMLCAAILPVLASADAWDPLDDTDTGATVLSPPTTTTQFHGPHEVLDASGDWEDWYAVDLVAGVLYHFDTTGSIGDAWMDVYEPGPSWLLGDDDNGGNRQPGVDFIATVTGTYFIQIGYNEYGWSGRLRYWSAPLPADAWDPADDTQGGATILPAPVAGVQAHGPLTLGGTDSEDWVALPLIAGTTVWVDTMGGAGDNWVDLYDASGALINWNDDDGGNRQPSLSFSSTYTGMFYFLIGESGYGWTGTFRYRLFAAPADVWDPGDDARAGATSITPGPVAQDHGMHLMSPDDCDDWFQFYGAAGQAFHFEFTGGPGQTYGEVNEWDGDWLTDDWQTGREPHFGLDVFLPGSGLHSLEVSNNNCGGSWAAGSLRYWRITTAEPGWTSTGLWHDVEDVTTPAGRPMVSASSRTFWYGGEARGTYDTDDINAGLLISPPYSIAAATATLYFSSWAQTENDPTQYDIRWVMVSTDDGQSWAPALQLGGIEEAWEAVSLSLSAYSGQIVRIGFHFDSVDGSGDRYLGWMIDDVRVDGTTAGSLRGSLAVTPSSAAGGTNVQVVLSVTNSGTAGVNGVTASLVPVSGGALVSPVSGPSPAGPVTLGVGAAQKFTWVYAVSGTGTAVFSGSATGSDAVTLAPVAVSTTASVSVQTPAILQAALSIMPARVQTGGLVTVVVTITNTGGATATGVGTSLGIGAPAFPLTLVSGPSPAGTFPVPAGGTASISWTYSAAGLGTATFTAVTSGTDTALGGAVGAAASATVLAKTALVSATLHVTLTAAPSPVAVGRWITVTAQVRNAGDIDAVGVSPSLGVTGVPVTVIAGPVPAGPVSIPGGQTTSFSWTLSPQGSGTAVLNLTAAGTDAVSSALISGSANGTVAVRHGILAGILTVPPTVRAGATVEIRLTLNNTGTGAVNAVVPSLAGTGFTPVSGPAPTGGSVAPGTSVTIIWSVRFDASGTVAIQALATGTDAQDGSTASVSVPATVAVTPGFDAPLMCYPNPVTGDLLRVAVRTRSPARAIHLEAWNVAAERVYDGAWTAGGAEESLEIRGVLGWAPGLYTLRVRAELADGTTETLPMVRLMVRP